MLDRELRVALCGRQPLMPEQQKQKQQVLGALGLGLARPGSILAGGGFLHVVEVGNLDGSFGELGDDF
jgi:hypothetical protein